MKSVLEKLGSLARRRSSSGDGPMAPHSSSDSGVDKSNIVEAQVARLKAAEEARKAREARLSALKPTCIDATMVECLSTGSETAEDKLHAFQLLSQSCGLKNIVLAAFVKENIPDMTFLQALRSQKLIDEHCLAFTELFDANGSDLPGQDLPFGLAKMIQFGIQNAILECDLAAPYINWNKYSISDFCALVESRCRWVAANLYAGRPTRPASYVHLRDFSTAMQVAPARVLELVEFLGRLDPAIRPRGILVLEPATGHFPFEAAPCVAAVRAVMDATGWTAEPPAGGAASGGAASGGAGGGGGGQLLVHVQAGFGLAHATVLECLAAGGTGVMASLCEEAAEPASAHASSLLDLVNLSRLGNTHVAQQFDMEQLRAAAAEVRRIMNKTAAAAAAAAAAQQQVAGGAGRAVAATQTTDPPAASGAPARPAALPETHHRHPLIPGHA